MRKTKICDSSTSQQKEAVRDGNENVVSRRAHVARVAKWGIGRVWAGWASSRLTTKAWQKQASREQVKVTGQKLPLVFHRFDTTLVYLLLESAHMQVVRSDALFLSSVLGGPGEEVTA